MLDFIAQYYGKKDLKAFTKHFDLATECKADPLVKAGGIRFLLESHLKRDKKL